MEADLQLIQYISCQFRNILQLLDFMAPYHVIFIIIIFFFCRRLRQWIFEHDKKIVRRYRRPRFKSCGDLETYIYKESSSYTSYCKVSVKIKQTCTSTIFPSALQKILFLFSRSAYAGFFELEFPPGFGSPLYACAP